MNRKVNKSSIKIGDILQNTRKSLGFTQEDVAEKLDLGSRYISDLERNKTKGSIDTLVKLCNIYNITPTYILQDYLNISNDYKLDSNIIGFYNLSQHDKEVIIQLIQYMNKQ